jgi:hypothetical protein
MSESTSRYSARSTAESQNARMLQSASSDSGEVPMSRRELYGKKAIECLVVADGMTTVENRVAMLKLAQCWMQLGTRSNDILARANRHVTALLSGAATLHDHHIG